jgi:hypothetical protein
MSSHIAQQTGVLVRSAATTPRQSRLSRPCHTSSHYQSIFRSRLIPENAGWCTYERKPVVQERIVSFDLSPLAPLASGEEKAFPPGHAESACSCATRKQLGMHWVRPTSRPLARRRDANGLQTRRSTFTMSCHLLGASPDSAPRDPSIRPPAWGGPALLRLALPAAATCIARNRNMAHPRG